MRLACKYVGEHGAPCFFGGLLLEHEHYKPGAEHDKIKTLPLQSQTGLFWDIYY